MKEIRYLPLDEFVEQGYLQEANRQFFHPLGLALEIQFENGHAMSISGIWDYRDDPEGVAFYEAGLATDEALRKAANIAKCLAAKSQIRQEILGYVVQPLKDQ